MFQMVPENEVRAFRNWVFAGAPNMPSPKNPWPPKPGPQGAFDAQPPWAKFRGMAYDLTKPDAAPVYQSHHGLNGGDLLQKIKELCEGDLKEGELLELDAAFAEQQRMREEATAGDETASASERLRKLHELGGEYVSHDQNREHVAEFLRRKGIADDEAAEILKKYDRDNMPKPATEKGGIGGRLGSAAPMASDRKMAALYGAHISRIIGELPLPDRFAPQNSST